MQFLWVAVVDRRGTTATLVADLLVRNALSPFTFLALRLGLAECFVTLLAAQIGRPRISSGTTGIAVIGIQFGSRPLFKHGVDRRSEAPSSRSSSAPSLGLGNTRLRLFFREPFGENDRTLADRQLELRSDRE